MTQRSHTMLRDLLQQRRSAALLSPLTEMGIQKNLILGETGPEYDNLDLVGVGLAVLNAILDGSAIAGGADVGDVMEAGETEVLEQCPNLSQEEATTVVAKVFDRLRNARGAQSDRFNRHVVEYWDPVDRRRTFRDFEFFKLDTDDDEERVILRLSREGKTLLLGMLEIEEELQDEIERVMMQKAIERGLFQDALTLIRRIATRASSCRHAIQILLTRARRSSVQVRWEDEGVGKITQSLDHLLQKTTQESLWLRETESRLINDELTPESRRHLIDLKVATEDLYKRNSNLLTTVVQANEEFRSATRYAFEPVHTQSLCSPDQDLLLPLLNAPTGASAELLEDVFYRLAAIQPPKVYCLSVMFDQFTAGLGQDDDVDQDEASVLTDNGEFVAVPPRISQDRSKNLTEWFEATVKAAGSIDSENILVRAGQEPTFTDDDIHAIALISHYRLTPMSRGAEFQSSYLGMASIAGHTIPKVLFETRR